MSDPKITRSIIIKINSIVNENDPSKKETKISDLINMLNSTERDAIDAKDLGPYISALLRNIADSRVYEEVIHILETIDSENKSLKEAKALNFFKNGDYSDAAITILSDRSFCESENAIEMLIKSSIYIEKYENACVFVSECGRYDERIFSPYIERERNASTNKKIIDNFINGGKNEYAIKFLKDIITVDRYVDYITDLIDLSERQNDIESLKYAISHVKPEDIREVKDAVEIAKACIKAEQYDDAIIFSEKGLNRDPLNYALLESMGFAYYKKDEWIKAINIYKKILDSYPGDKEAFYRLIDISYEYGKYDLFLDAFSSIKGIDLRAQDYIRMSQIVEKAGDIDGAVKNINAAISRFPDDPEVMRAAAKLSGITGNLDLEHEMYKKLLAANPGDSEALRYTLNFQYKNAEYSGFIETYEKCENDDVKNDFTGFYASSLIYLEEIEKAVAFVGQRPGIMDDGFFLDAVFFTVRRDPQIETLMKLNPEKSYLMVIIDRLIGKRIKGTDYIMDYAVEKCSLSLAWISVWNYIEKYRTLTEKVRAAISVSCLGPVYAISDSVSSIMHSQAQNSDADAPDFLYPISISYISTGNYERAEKILQSIWDKSSDDPFYHYTYAYLFFMEGKVSQAKKSVEKAMQILTNIDFLRLHLLVSPEDAMDDVKKLASIDPDEIPFDDLEMKYSLNKDFLEKAVSFFDSSGISNEHTLRFRRDYYFLAGKYPESLETIHSLPEDKVSEKDITAYFNIFLKAGKEEDAYSYLSANIERIKDLELLRKLGDYYYKKNLYGDAIKAYRNAIRNGCDPKSIPGYIDSLIEIGAYNEVSDILKNIDNPGIYGIKFYFRSGDIEKIKNIIKNTKKMDVQTFQYLIQNAWKNDGIRDEIMNLYNSEGFPQLGLMIARKLFELGKPDEAIKIVRNLHENVPGNMDIAIALIDMLIGTGRFPEAHDLVFSFIEKCNEEGCRGEFLKRIYRIDYEMKNYDEIIKTFKKNRVFDGESLQYVIRSYIHARDFDNARNIADSYGSMIGKEEKERIYEDIQKYDRLDKTIHYVSRLLKAEYRAGYLMDRSEAAKKIDIPGDLVPDVFAFLESKKYYGNVVETDLESLSGAVIRDAFKHRKIKNIDDIKISTIYGVMREPDPVTARNLYIYIKSSLNVIAATTDENVINLAKEAIKKGINADPLSIVVNMGTGIRTAMAILNTLALMEKDKS